MPQQKFDVIDVINALGLEINPRQSPQMPSFNVRCPFCDDKKYHMNVNTEKDLYKCFRCGDKGGTAADLYSRVMFGERCQKGDKDVYKKVLKALTGDEPGATARQPVRERNEKPAIEYARRASDDVCDAVYRELATFPEFKLSEEHKKKLLERGLDEEAIQENGYFTIPKPSWVEKPEYEEYRAKAETFLTEAHKLPTLAKMSDDYLLACFIVGQKISEKLNPEGVPGMFYAGDWAFKLESGMMIPVRSYKGKIVGGQVRKDQGQVKYMTVSSKHLPKGVDQGILRTHFPKSHAKASADIRAFITEGPLKADVATRLLQKRGENPLFIAILGVNAKQDLPEILKHLAGKGVKCVYNALDLDRLTNPAVTKASSEIDGMITAAGMQPKQLLWDKDGADKKRASLEALATANDIIVETGNNPYAACKALATALHQHHVEYDKTWEGAGKGIDDWLSHK